MAQEDIPIFIFILFVLIVSFVGGHILARKHSRPKIVDGKFVNQRFSTLFVVYVMMISCIIMLIAMLITGDLQDLFS